MASEFSCLESRREPFGSVIFVIKMIDSDYRRSEIKVHQIIRVIKVQTKADSIPLFFPLKSFS